MSTGYPPPAGDPYSQNPYPQNAYPQTPYPQQYAPPAYRLYDVAAIAIAAFFGGPLAGAILMASNYRKLGQGNNAMLALVLGAAGSAVEIFLSLKSTASPLVATVVLFLATAVAGRQLQEQAVKTHVAWGGQLYSKWRAFGVAIATIVILGGALIGYLVYTGQWQTFGAQYGIGQQTVTIGTKDQVIYSGTATKDEATALGNALKTAGYFQDRGVSVLLNKGTGGTTIGFVVQDGEWNQPNAMLQFADVVYSVASTAGGLPVQLQLLNGSQAVEKSGAVGDVDFGGGDVVIYEGTATQANAQALGQQLKTLGYFTGKGANVFVAKDNGTTLGFVVADGTWDNASDVSDFEIMVRGVASTVGGLPIDLRLLNSTLVDEKDETVQ
ncbi:MAG TPA: hypothetical protein VMT38_13470 [Terracidiphilus sp.]|nr:hypothetical protein [Terracidiphilus sp.]